MSITSVLEQAGAAIDTRRVFSEPIERDGTTIVLAAKLGGGGGGGEGRQAAEGKPEGAGMGFGLAAKPAGAFVIRNGRVRWRPAIDVNRVILGGQLVAATALLVLRSILRARLRQPVQPRRVLLQRLLQRRRPGFAS